VSHAAALAAANARLQATVRGQLTELRASRRRLLDAGDEERRRLERRLHDGAARELAGLAATLGRVRSLTAGGPPATAVLENVANAEAQLARTLTDLDALARGLHPRDLAEHGLPGALKAVAAGCAVDVALTVTSAPLPPAVEVTAYFVCTEALANIAKHASAARASIDVRCSAGRATVRVRDDGVGGARIGGGLRGLADRVAAHGGSLSIESPPGRGTLLVAEIPVEAS
jgi:signal transduction histidine kinase